MPKPGLPKKLFTIEDRHKLTEYGINTHIYSWKNDPETVRRRTRNEKRKIRLTHFFEQLHSSNKYDNIHFKEKVWERHTKAEQYYQLKDKAEINAFLKESRRLRIKIQTTQKQRELAKQKAEVILHEGNNTIRLDNLARMVTQLSLKRPFESNEVAQGLQGVLSFRGSPKSVVTAFYCTFANQVALWGGLAKYTALAYFKPGLLEYEQTGYSGYKYGRLNENQKLYAVQVMHWDPKVLEGFTKGMLKKRPNDPIAVFDLYGNRFFP